MKTIRLKKGFSWVMAMTHEGKFYVLYGSNGNRYHCSKEKFISIGLHLINKGWCRTE